MSQSSPATSPASQSTTRKPVWVKNLGFTTLFEPEDQTPVADVIFVHGLQGHPWRTWRYKGSVVTRTFTQDPEVKKRRSLFRRSTTLKTWEKKTEFGRAYWPAEFLPLDQDNVRILTYGYDSRVTKWFGGAANQMNIEQHGNSFLHSLEAERRTCRDRPLIFIVHSLGGLVIKQAVAMSRAEEHHQHLRDLYDSLHGIIFFGTPQRGSKDASWGLMLKNIANAALFDTNDSILRELNPSSGGERLDRLSSTLGDVLAEKDIRVTTFQESKGKAGTIILHGKVVPNESSALNLEKYELKDAILSNHMDMCRFRGPEDDGYIKAKNAIASHISRIKSLEDQSKDESRGVPQKLPSISTPPVAEKASLAKKLSRVQNETHNPDDEDISQELAKSLYFRELNTRRHQVYEDHSDAYSWIWSNKPIGPVLTEWLSKVKVPIR